MERLTEILAEVRALDEVLENLLENLNTVLDKLSELEEIIGSSEIPASRWNV